MKQKAVHASMRAGRGGGRAGRASVAVPAGQAGTRQQPFVSIIVPVYNGEGEIGRCLRALQGQSYSGRKEIIVVDDGSTDRTAQEVLDLGVRLLSRRHRGPAAARNAGAQAARGEIVLFTDADCVPWKSWVSEMVKPFANPQVEGVQGAYKSLQRELVARFSQLEIEGRYERMKQFDSVDFIGTYSGGYRRTVFLKAGGFDESFPMASGEDPEFSFRLARAGSRLVFNPAAIVHHEHPSTLREYLRVKFWRAYWRVPLYRKHKDKAARDTYTPQGLKLQVGLLCLLLASLVVSLAVEQYLLLAAGAYVLLLLSTLPFSFWAFSRDRAAGLASPVILQLRSIVFLLGMAEGLFRAGGSGNAEENAIQKISHLPKGNGKTHGNVRQATGSFFPFTGALHRRLYRGSPAARKAQKATGGFLAEARPGGET